MGNNKLKSFRQFLTEEDGMGTVEVILIIVGILPPYYGVGIKCIE